MISGSKPVLLSHLYMREIRRKVEQSLALPYYAIPFSPENWSLVATEPFRNRHNRVQSRRPEPAGVAGPGIHSILRSLQTSFTPVCT